MGWSYFAVNKKGEIRTITITSMFIRQECKKYEHSTLVGWKDDFGRNGSFILEHTELLVCTCLGTAQKMKERIEKKYDSMRT
jgi:hypothetical protein